MIIAGDLIEIRCSHPTLGNKVFFPKSGEAATKSPGGLRTTDDEDNVTAGGTINVITRKQASFEVVVGNDENDNNELEYAIKASGDPADGEWTFTHVNGVVYGMTGRPVGDLSGDLGAGTFTLKVAGFELKKIAG